MKEQLIDFVNDWKGVLTDSELQEVVVILVKSLEEKDKMELGIKHTLLKEFIFTKLGDDKQQTNWLYATVYKL